ncbi:MAG: DUF4373 domain-containing protein [Colwellia sp.]|nr:DUF4373 domain-containing protein [Colwellia sp.]
MKEYFSHDYNARNDTKLVKVFMKHGLSGIGAFWCIVEMLYEESGYLIRTEYERIAFELRTDTEVIRDIVESYDLFQLEDDKFYSSSALDRLNERMTKSEKARKSVQKRWEKHKRNTNVLDSNNDRNTSKVKESKVKESKETIYSFDDFWKTYPVKKQKKDCEKKYEKIKESDREKIKNTISSFISHKPFDSYSLPNPSTYLNQERWNDELTSKIIQHEQQPAEKAPAFLRKQLGIG